VGTLLTLERGVRSGVLDGDRLLPDPPPEFVRGDEPPLVALAYE
jgi:hypothetical protein